jgi:hypothetical protein
MTNGLLISRKRKVALHKKTLLDPTEQNIQEYKIYRNVYNKLIRVNNKFKMINAS